METPNAKTPEIPPATTSKKPIFLGLVAGLFSVSIVAFFNTQFSSAPEVPVPPPTPREEEQVFCTADVKECPGGNYVKRIPPTCEFEACPEDTSSISQTEPYILDLSRLYSSAADVVVEFPRQTTVTYNEANVPSISLNDEAGTQYEVRVQPGLCPWGENPNNCTYEDQEMADLGKHAIVRIWQDDKRGVFALNFQSLNVAEDVYVDHFEVFKTSPNKEFSTREIELWKNLVENIRPK